MEGWDNGIRFRGLAIELGRVVGKWSVCGLGLSLRRGLGK